MSRTAQPRARTLADRFLLRSPKAVGPRVAVLRALQLGDLLCAVPALRALRAALPDAEVTLVGLPWAAEFVARFPRYVDRLIDFPGYPGLPERTPPDLASFPRFLAEVHRRRFDLVVQMHGAGEITNPLALLLGGTTTAGFRRSGAFCPDPDCFLPYPDGEPEVRRLLDLMRFLGAPADDEHLEFPLHDDDRRLAHEATGGTLAGRGYACVHPGARMPDRRWSSAGFSRAADAIAARGLRIVFTGNSDEGSFVGEIAAGMQAPAINLAGRTSLGALAALLADARLLVCNDTGVSHIADALGVPSVVIYAASDPERWAPLDRARHRVVVAGAASDDAVLAQVLGEIHDLLATERMYAA